MALNPQQMAAVKYIEGPLLVLAGAGSGKTKVITEKIAYLIESCGFLPQSIMALTFTNKAAFEMKARMQTLLSKAQRRGLKVSTFHVLGMNILKRDADRLGLSKRFTIFDADDALQLMKSSLGHHSLEREVMMRYAAQISRWKNDLLSPEQVMNLDADEASVPGLAIELYHRYQESLLAYQGVDFDDLIRLPVALLNTHADVLSFWQAKIRYLLIDEYQDSNASQYALVSLLVGQQGAFTAVGDDDQSIYAWRGAKPENMLILKQDYPSLKLIKLEQNYRSTGNILQAANHLIANNPHLFEKSLWSEWGPGASLRVLVCQSEVDEAELVIADLISHKLRKGRQYRDYAILYRSNHQSRIFEKLLRHHGIAYQMSGGQSWFSRMEVKDILAYLKLMVNEADDAAFLRIINTPRRGIGESTLAALAEYAHARGQSFYAVCDHMALVSRIGEKQREALLLFKRWLLKIKTNSREYPLLQVLTELVAESGYEAYLYEQGESSIKVEKKMASVWDLVNFLVLLQDKQPEAELTDLINKIILMDMLSQEEEADAETVQLMTLHAAKGLEFPYVYLVGMEEDILPHRVSIDGAMLEEERRLAYVGMTRAQKELCFSLAKQRRTGGELRECSPSRFLDELPPEILEWYGKDVKRDEAQSKVLANSHLTGLKNMLRE